MNNSEYQEIVDLLNTQIKNSKLDVPLIDSDQPLVLDILKTTIKNILGSYETALKTLEPRTEELEMLNAIAETINRTLDLQQVIDTSLRGALKTIDWQMGAIYMWDKRDQMLHMVSFIGYGEEDVRERISYTLGEGNVGLAAKSRETVQNTFQTNNSDVPEPELNISIPLVSAPDEFLGVLSVSTRQNTRLTKERLKLLSTVAHQVSIAIGKAQLYATVNKHAMQLEELVRERTKQLDNAVKELSVALERAQETDKLKSLLLTTVSHELRTPLATIKGNSSLLLQHFDNLTKDILHDTLLDIDEETDKLTELISNLLEMSRIKSGMLHIHQIPIDIIDVIDGAVSAAKIRNPDHPIAVELLTPSMSLCMGDGRRIEQIIANLMDNASKYSESGMPIKVEVAQKQTEIIICVRDRGVGIPQKIQDHVFERFFQASGQSADKIRDGIGLGLAICKGLVEAHGGRIWLESVVGQGSAFSFSLPVVDT